MSLDSNIKAGEVFAKDLAAKKEADRVAALSPEQKKEQEAQVAQAKQAEADKVILEADESKLDEAGKARKAEIAKAAGEASLAEEKRILTAKDEELSAEDRARKSDIVAGREKKKQEEWQKSVDARVGEVKAELLIEKNARVKDQDKIKALEAEIAEAKGLKGPSAEELAAKEEARIAGNIEKDKALPKAQRREMSDEELQEWLIEDMVAAQRWLSKQELRRDKERDADLKAASDGDVTKRAEAVIAKQKVSKVQAEKNYPEAVGLLNKVAARARELAREGKSDKEQKEIIEREIPNASVINEILKEDQDAFAYSEDGPELLAEAISGRMKKTGTKETQDERDDRIRQEAVQAERERQEKLPANLRSNYRRPENDELSGLEKEQLEIFLKQFPGKTKEDFKKMQARRAERAGV